MVDRTRIIFGAHKRADTRRLNEEMNGNIEKELATNRAFTTVVSCRGMFFCLLGISCHDKSALVFGLLAFRVAMEMDPERADSNYRVEVSGWDVAETFFVEKVRLQLTQAGERVVHLQHPLREGLIVFLRLMESRITFPALPVAYRVITICPGERDGVSRVSLRKLRHRKPRDSETVATDAIELL